MLVASDDVTSGSVTAKEERISASSSERSHRSFCSGVPKLASTSMLPVSGAAQLRTAGERRQLRQVISASGMYWKFVSPAPCLPGKNRSHRPRLRASARSCLMTGTIDQAQGSVSPASC